MACEKEDTSCLCTDPTSYCNLDRRNNMWVEGIVDPVTGAGGICMLDTMTREQVVFVLERTPGAKQDLLKVTSDPELRTLAQEVNALDTDTTPEEQKAFDQPSLPFYSLFRGNYDS